MRVIRKKVGKEKVEKEALREVLMRMLVFALQHHFLYVLEDEWNGEERKAFYYQFQGIYIGSSASGAIANLALLGREREVLRDLRGWDRVRIPLYFRLTLAGSTFTLPNFSSSKMIRVSIISLTFATTSLSPSITVPISSM